MNEENEKNKLETTEGIFIGTEFKGEGKTKKGKDWKRYKAKFKPHMESDKEFSFTVFTPLTAKNTKQMEDMKDGEKYKILYSSEERTFSQGGQAPTTYTSKTIVGIYSPSEENSNSNQQQTQAPAQNSFKPDLSNFGDFASKYLNLIKASKMEPNAVHMLGSYIATYERDRTAELLNKCQEIVKGSKTEPEPPI